MALRKGLKSLIPETIVQQSKMFVPKVRMYEIQMMGVMESEQSNISIPYLLEDGIRYRQGRPPISYNSHPTDFGSYPGGYLVAQGGSYKAQLTENNRPASFLFGMKESKKGVLTSIFPLLRGEDNPE